MWFFAMLDQVHLRAATYTKNAKNALLIAPGRHSPSVLP
jgi:hypothetical protein